MLTLHLRFVQSSSDHTGSTHRLLHNYGYKRTPPYRAMVDGSAVPQCQASDVQRPLKDV